MMIRFKRTLTFLTMIALLLTATPAMAESSAFSLTTDTAPSSVLLMDENGNSLSTVLGSQALDGQIHWTLQVTNNGADVAYLYTKDENGNWLNSGITYLMSWIFPDAGDQPAAESAPPETAWPVRTYQSIPISIIPLPEDKRVQSRTGPAKTYHGAGGYKTYKMTAIDALFMESGFVLVDLSYTTVGRRRLYFAASAFEDTNNVPAESLTATSAYTTEDLIPTFGPGYSYDTFDEAAISSGTSLSVYFEESGWVFAEFDSALGIIRAWIPASQVRPQ